MRGVFKRAVSAASELKRVVFIELFAGCNLLTACLKERGLAALSFSLNCAAVEDHLSPVFLQTLRGWIRGRAVSGVWVAIPAASWTSVQCKPLRSPHAPLGRENLNEHETARLSVGNAIFVLSCKVIEECI